MAIASAKARPRSMLQKTLEYPRYAKDLSPEERKVFAARRPKELESWFTLRELGLSRLGLLTR